MKREFKGIQRKGLPGGPHEQFTYVTGVFMQDMYHVPEAQKGLEKYQLRGQVPLMAETGKSKTDALAESQKEFKQLANNIELQPIYPFEPMKKGEVENNAEEFLTKMINSPLFADRYNTMRGYTTPASKEEIDHWKTNMLSNIQNVDYWPVGFDYRNEKFPDTYLASYNVVTPSSYDKYQFRTAPKNHRELKNKVRASNQEHRIFRKNDAQNLATHELSHASTMGSLPAKKIPLSKDPAKQDAVKKYSSYYHQSNTEMKAWLDEVRQYLYDKNIYDATSKEFDENDYNNLIGEYEKVKEELKNTPNNKYLKYIKGAIEKFTKPYDKEQTIQAFNSFVDNTSNEELPIGQKGLEKYQGDEKSETKESRRDFIKRYNQAPFGLLKSQADGVVKFNRNLTKEEFEKLGIITDYPSSFDIITSSLNETRNLGSNRRYGVYDGDEYAEIPKNSELWKDLYKQNKKAHRDQLERERLRNKEWTGKKEFKLTQNIIDQLNYLQGLKKGDKDFDSKYDIDDIWRTILDDYNIRGFDKKTLKRKTKFNKNPNDYATELAQKYITDNEPIPTLSKGQEIIVSKDGQYAHPGKITRIPGNNITMKGVSYPVFAIPNVGMPTMMQSGQDYYFPDADYVDEIPMMQDGNGEKYLNYLKGALIPGYSLVQAAGNLAKKRIANSVTPFGYDVGHALKEFIKGEPIPIKYKSFDEQGNPVDKEFLYTGEEGATAGDALSIYLGLPQKYNSFKKTDLRPTISSGEDIDYYSLVSDDDLYDLAINIGLLDAQPGTIENIEDSEFGDLSLKTFNISKGFDKKLNLPYISYADRNDYNVPTPLGTIPVENIIGKPFGIYGRMYYDPKTKKRLFPEKQKGGTLPKYQISGPENIAQVQSDNTRTVNIPVFTADEIGKAEANKKRISNNPYSIIPEAVSNFAYEYTGIPALQRMAKDPAKYKAALKTFMSDLAKASALAGSTMGPRQIDPETREVLQPEGGYANEVMDMSVIGSYIPMIAGMKVLSKAPALTPLELLQKADLKYFDNLKYTKYDKTLQKLKEKAAKKWEKKSNANTNPSIQKELDRQFILDMRDVRNKIIRKKGKKASLPLDSEIGSGAQGTVYQLADHPDQLVKLSLYDDSKNIFDLIERGKPFLDDINIGLPYFAKKDINSDIFATLMNKVPGKGIDNISIPSGSIPRDAVAELALKLKRLKDHGIYADYSGFNNFLYDPVSKKFSVVDLNTDKALANYNKANQNIATILKEKFGKLIEPKKQDGGSTAKKQLNADLLKTYKNYINGVDESAEAVRAYDKLNRIFYKESKLNNMSAPNYIMTHIIPNA